MYTLFSTYLFHFAKTAEQCKQGFFGLNPWYQYLELDGNCNIINFNILGAKSSIPRILLAVIDDLLRIAALVAIAFVLVGAINLITSQGNPDDSSKAQGTIINALIGLAIAIVSIAFVTFLGSRLGK